MALVNSQPVTDVWFTSERDLRVLAVSLGFKDTTYDQENHWESVIGTFEGVRLNMTRTHNEPAETTPIAIFRYDGIAAWNPLLLQPLIQNLQGLGITPISLGKRTYLRGNEYEYIAYEQVS